MMGHDVLIGMRPSELYFVAFYLVHVNLSVQSPVNLNIV